MAVYVNICGHVDEKRWSKRRCKHTDKQRGEEILENKSTLCGNPEVTPYCFRRQWGMPDAQIFLYRNYWKCHRWESNLLLGHSGNEFYIHQILLALQGLLSKVSGLEHLDNPIFVSR